RYRRRIDRAGADRARRSRSAHPGLAERPLGRGLAHRDRWRARRQRQVAPGPLRRDAPHGRRQLRRVRRAHRPVPGARAQAARHQWHRNHPCQPASRPAAVRPQGGGRPDRAVGLDARHSDAALLDVAAGPPPVAVHRPGTRRSGRGGLRHSRRHSRHLAGRAAWRCRSGDPRRDPARTDGGRCRRTGGPSGLAPVEAGRLMSRSGKDADRRVRTARGRTASSTRWLERQLNDPYVKQAKAEGYRSRAAYKLIELDDRFGLLKGTKRVVDLGIAPGGWSQVVRKRAPAAGVVGIDLLETEPLEGVTILQMDFMADEAPQALEAALDGAPDLVLSDMAANTV